MKSSRHQVHRRAASTRGRVRRSLSTTTTEGIVAEFVSICAGGVALTAWALQLDAGPSVIAALVALPALAQMLQLPAARLTARFGARRTALVASVAARQPYALLAPLPWLPVSTEAKLALLVAVAAAAAAFGTVAQHAWLSWMTELFRAPVRIGVLARRASRVAFVSAVGGLGVGVLLDRSGAARGATLAVLAVLAWAAGCAAAWLLRAQHAPRTARDPRPADLSLRAALEEKPVRRGLRYVFAWNAAMGLTASVSAMYMLTHLGLGFIGLGVHGLAVATGALVMAPLWSRAIDRLGIPAVIVVSTLGAALLPFLWLLSSERVLWPIVLDAVFAGALMGGQSAAVTALPVALAPQGRRSEVLAAYSTTSGLAFGAASLIAGFVTARLPFFVFFANRLFVARKLVLAAGGAVRIVAALLGLRLLRDGRGAPDGA